MNYTSGALHLYPHRFTLVFITKADTRLQFKWDPACLPQSVSLRLAADGIWNFLPLIPIHPSIQGISKGLLVLSYSVIVMCFFCISCVTYLAYSLVGPPVISSLCCVFQQRRGWCLIDTFLNAPWHSSPSSFFVSCSFTGYTPVCCQEFAKLMVQDKAEVHCTHCKLPQSLYTRYFVHTKLP
jgi:hypothetical protein